MREEVKAGVIIVSSLLVLTVLVVLIGGSRFYEKTDLYFVRVMNAAGLEPGSQVRLGGVKVGRVRDIRGPQGPGKPVTIEVALQAGTPVYKGTKAVVTQIGFVGDIYLLLAVDKASGERIPPGQEIPSEEATGFAQIMGRLDTLSQTVAVLVRDMDALFNPKNVRAVEQLLGNTNDAIVKGTASLEQLTGSLKATSEKIEVILADVEDVVRSNKGEVAGLLRRAHEDLDRASEMIKSIEATARSVTQATGSADRAIQVQSRNLSALIETMNRTAQDLQEAVQEIRNKPWSLLYKERRSQ